MGQTDQVCAILSEEEAAAFEDFHGDCGDISRSAAGRRLIIEALERRGYDTAAQGEIYTSGVPFLTWLAQRVGISTEGRRP